MTTQRNFDIAALDWDEKPGRVKLAEDIAAAIMEKLPLSTEWDALDFGCGTGLVTLRLAPALHSITGVDGSRGMLEQLTAKIQQSGLGHVHAEFCNLEKGEFPTGRYHLITSAMTLHHIENIVPLLRMVKTALHPGGRVALADFETEDGSFHDDPTGVFHHGFSSEELTTLLEQAGFSEISIARVTSVGKGDRSYPVLLATARLR
jgi:ubiquinone/menaquinone biosynthesis C-methylase UbiE